jgi:hypothetical protein
LPRWCRKHSDHVVFFADDGTAYTMRITEVPASSGYGEPITKYFRFADKVKVAAAVTTDPRFTPADQPGTDETPGGPYLLVVTAQDKRCERRWLRFGTPDEGRAALRAAGRGRPGRDGHRSAMRRASSSPRPTATSSTSRSSRSMSCRVSARA